MTATSTHSTAKTISGKQPWRPGKGYFCLTLEGQIDIDLLVIYDNERLGWAVSFNGTYPLENERPRLFADPTEAMICAQGMAAAALRNDALLLGREPEVTAL